MKQNTEIVLLLMSLLSMISCQGGSQEETAGSKPLKGPVKVGQSDSIVPLERFFDRDTQPYAFVLPSLKPLEGVGGVTAQNCSQCHTQYYREWSQTTHAHALSDLQFQAELAKPGSPQWLCLNCHIPNQDQREHRVVGLDSGDVLKPILEPNPKFNKAFQQEAISCATCHLRANEEGETEVIGAIGSKLAPHPIRKDPQALRQTCLRCHDPKGEAITPNLMCWFQTQAELRANPEVKDQDCVSCHMPTEMGSLVPGMPKRLRHQHHWVGGGISKTMKGLDSTLARGYHSGLILQPQMKSGVLELELKNTAGHALPSADPERYYRIDVLVKLKDQIVLDTNYRFGQTWEWSPARKIADNRLMGAESRRVRFPLEDLLGAYWSSEQRKQLKIEVIASHHRLSLENLEHMKKAPVNESLSPGVTERLAQMEVLYPRFRMTHKFEMNWISGDWVLEKWTPEQLLKLTKDSHLSP